MVGVGLVYHELAPPSYRKLPCFHSRLITSKAQFQLTGTKPLAHRALLGRAASEDSSLRHGGGAEGATKEGTTASGCRSCCLV